MDAGTLAMVSTYREALQCEAVREAVFAGKTTPMVYGVPQPWIPEAPQLPGPLSFSSEQGAVTAGAPRVARIRRVLGTGGRRR